MRWANRQIDDFTLRIKATNTAKHFFVEDSLFSQEQFVVKDGVGKIRKTESGAPYNILRKKVIIAVFIKSANIAPIIGTIRKGLTV